MKQSVFNMAVSVWRILREGLSCWSLHDAHGRQLTLYVGVSAVMYMYALFYTLWYMNIPVYGCQTIVPVVCGGMHFFITLLVYQMWIITFWWILGAYQTHLVEPLFVNTHGVNKWPWYNVYFQAYQKGMVLRYFPCLSDHNIFAIPGHWLDITWYQESRHFFWLANSRFGFGRN